MQFTDEQWEQIRQVAEAKAMQLTHGDVMRSQDLASLVIEKLVVREGEPPANIRAYVREMVKNAYLDSHARQHAAYRGGPSLRHPMDEGIHAIAEAVAGVFKESLLTKSPSAQYFRRERADARQELVARILATLPERKQRLLRMVAEGHTHAEIALAMGYRNAAVVTTTLHRIYREIRDSFDLQVGDLFSSTGP